MVKCIIVNPERLPYLKKELMKFLIEGTENNKREELIKERMIKNETL
jgi:hypothetical protein